jgi:Ca2+-binding RTX toxin-like protein
MVGSGTANEIRSNLTVHAGGQMNDMLMVQDTGETANTQVTVTSNQVGAANGDNLFGGGNLTYTGLQLGMLMLDTGRASEDVRINSTHTGQTMISTHNGADLLRIRSTSGRTSLDGGPMNDTFEFGNQATLSMGSITGGEGERDLLTYAAYSTSIGVDLMLGMATGTGRVDTIEDVTGGSARDRIAGNDAVNMILGMNGRDVLLGRGGNDTLEGGRGRDRMDGGLGRDIFIVQNIVDLILGVDSIRLGGLGRNGGRVRIKNRR